MTGGRSPSTTPPPLSRQVGSCKENPKITESRGGVRGKPAAAIRALLPQPRGFEARFQPALVPLAGPGRCSPGYLTARCAAAWLEPCDVERVRPLGEDAVAGVRHFELPGQGAERRGCAADEHSAADARQVGEHPLTLAPGDVAGAELGGNARLGGAAAQDSARLLPQRRRRSWSNISE